jgi:predicted ester cyclase
MSTEANKDFIRKYFEALSGKPKPPAVLDEFMTDKDLKKHIIETETAFPEYELVAEDVIAEGDKVVVRASLKAVHTGDMMGIPPTGKTVNGMGIVIYQIKNDKIEKSWISFDRMSMMEQLGLVPSAAQ